MRNTAGRFVSGIAVAATLFFASGARAQELKDELNALQDTPTEDTTGAPKAKGKKKAAIDPIDSLPTDGPPVKSADVSLPAPSTPEIPPADENLEGLGSGNPETDVGLEKELRTLDERTKPSDGPPIANVNGEAEPTGKVVNLDFRQLSDRVRLTVKADRVVEWNRELRSKRKQIILDLKNMTIGRAILKRAFDTGEFDGPVALVQAFESKVGGQPAVKVLFQLRQFVDPTVMRTGNDLVIDFPILTDMTIFKDKAETQVQLPETFLSIGTKMTSVGHKINLNVKDADLQDILNLISRASGKNFVYSAGGVNPKVTMNVKNTPWDEVLRLILINATPPLGYQKVGNIYRIAKVSDLRTEINETAKAVKDTEDLKPFETRLFALSYATAGDLQANITDFLSQSGTRKGKISIDKRTNTLVVTDISEVLEKISRYLRSVDRQTAQVLVEGRIVEAKKDFLKRLALGWGPTVNTGAGPISLNIGQATALAGTNGPLANNLNMPLSSLGSWGGITALISAEETENNVKTIASPRIVVLNNQKASMSQGDSIPTVTPGAGNNPATTTFTDALLSIDVQPQVTTDGYVMMTLTLKRDSPAAVGTGINKRGATTQVLVESGKTVVLGGIYTSDSDESIAGLPWLRSVPIFGALFRNSTVNRDRTNELLMFISPKILNPDKAFLLSNDREVADDAGSKPISSTTAESPPDDVF